MSQISDSLDILEQLPVPSSLREEIVKALRDAIINGAIKPREKIKEAALARKFGTSRGPVREALVNLELEGLIVRNRHYSPFVAEFSGERINEVTDMRWLLETHAMETAINKAKEDDLKRLENVLSEMREARDLNRRDLFVDADLRFHQEIIKFSGNATFITMETIRLFLCMLRFRWM